MKLGFIGTGKITSSVISGICSSKLNYKKIFISSRNSLIAKGLKKSLKRYLLKGIIKKLLIIVIGFFWQSHQPLGRKLLKI